MFSKGKTPSGGLRGNLICRSVVRSIILNKIDAEGYVTGGFGGYY